MANFKPLTRYTNANTTLNRNNEEFLVLRQALNLEPADDDTFVTIIENFINRPDLIGQTAYGSSKLWWVIYEFNNIKDPFFELRPGQVLRIPSKQRVLDAINNLNKE